MDPQLQLMVSSLHLVQSPYLHLPYLYLTKSYLSFSCRPIWTPSKIRSRPQSRPLHPQSRSLRPKWSQRSSLSRLVFPTYILENRIWAAIVFASNVKIISIRLVLTETTGPRLRLLFSKMALAPAGHSTNAGMLKKKGQMMLYPGKSSRPSFAKIAAIPELL